MSVQQDLDSWGCVVGKQFEDGQASELHGHEGWRLREAKMVVPFLRNFPHTFSMISLMKMTSL